MDTDMKNALAEIAKEQEEMNKEIVAVGVAGRKYTRGELQDAFSEIQDKENWKKSFTAQIDEAEFDKYNEAAIFFAGSPLEIIHRSNNKLTIHGDGYYVCIGA
jgi:hypothetical protein